jgi:hypothetical protein
MLLLAFWDDTIRCARWDPFSDIAKNQKFTRCTYIRPNRVCVKCHLRSRIKICARGRFAPEGKYFPMDPLDARGNSHSFYATIQTFWEMPYICIQRRGLLRCAVQDSCRREAVSWTTVAVVVKGKKFQSTEIIIQQLAFL